MSIPINDETYTKMADQLRKNVEVWRQHPAGAKMSTKAFLFDLQLFINREASRLDEGVENSSRPNNNVDTLCHLATTILNQLEMIW